jgi:uncharacterized protein YuzB (UPF0349 family)
LSYENIGTKTSPLFAARQENPFSLTNNNHSNSTTAFVDLDKDGDLDLMSGSSTGDFEYYENIGTKTSPLFAGRQENPFSLTDNNHSNSTTAFADLDNDGDLDLLSGSSTGDFEYFKNSSPLGINNSPQEQMPVIIYPNPSSGLVTIEISNSIVRKIEIKNIVGEPIHQSAIKWLDNKQIDLSALPKGLYLINIYIGDIFYVEKVELK